MINPREFCREPGYPIAVLFAYAIDPVFFERIPLRDLDVGGSRRIIAVADGEEIAKSVSRSMNHVVHLGRRYLLAEAAIAGAFHPKLIVRLGPEKGRVWIGSGNLTSGGWGGNHELAASWTIGPGERDAGTWLMPMFESVAALVRSTAFGDQLDETRRLVRWLDRDLGAAAPPAPALLTSARRPLALQLAERWRGRRFRELKICTGSTDVGGAFLRWARDTFGIEKVTLCLNPRTASFDPIALGRLGIDIGIVPSSGPQPMHAKFYWFEGERDVAAVMGSANCSRSAWLLPYESRGNIELVVPYDEAPAAEFESVLARFNRRRESPREVFAPQPATSDETAEPRGGFRIVSLRLRSGSGTVDVRIEPQPSADAVVTLVLRNAKRTASLPLAKGGDLLHGVAPAGMSESALFAFAEIRDGARVRTTPFRWVDNDTELERAVRDERSDPGLGGLGRRGISSQEAQRIMQAVQRVAAQIFSGRAVDEHAFAGGRSGKRGDREKGIDDQRSAPAVDAAVMIRDIRDLLSPRLGHAGLGFHPNLSIAVGGFARLLFRNSDEDGTRLDDEIEPAYEPELNGAPPKPGQTGPVAPTTGIPPEDFSIDLAARTRFAAGLRTCLDQLKSPKFAASCDPRQMVDAAAFILFLCVQGRNGGWVSPSRLGEVAAEITEVLFDGRYAPNLPRGLIYILAQRCAENGEEVKFREVVGDGALWTALIAALATSGSAELQSAVTRASALSRVYRSRDLLQTPDRERLALLVRNLNMDQAENAILELAPRSSEALEHLTNVLRDRRDELYREQGSGRQLIDPGSVLWDEAYGWKIASTRTGQAYIPEYVNVTAASAAHREIAEAVSRLQAAMASDGA